MLRALHVHWKSQAYGRAQQQGLARVKAFERWPMHSPCCYASAIIPKNRSPGGDDGLSLSDVRARIKNLKNQVEVLKGVPTPPSNIREKVQTYVQGLTRPVVSGIALDEALTVQWPTGLHALMAFLQPDVLVERLMTEIDRIANTPCPPAQREQQIARLEEEIDRLQRTEEAIVVATGAPREAGCPPWVVLGVKVTEAPGVQRRMMSR